MPLDRSESPVQAGASEGPKPLPINRLRRVADLSALAFTSTAELEPIDGFPGQERALDAVRFGSSINKPGFNLFVIGSTAARMQRSVETMLQSAAADRAVPPDWIYVNNFVDPHKPVAIRLPAGRAPHFRAAIHDLIEDLKAALPGAFASEDYQTRRGAIDEAFHKKQADAFTELREKAEKKGLILVRMPLGFALAPAQRGEVVAPEEFHKWDEAKRREVEESIQSLEMELEHVVRQLPSWEKAHRDETRKLNRDTANLAVGQSIDEAKTGFADLPEIAAHLEMVRADLVENVGMFVTKAEGEESPAIDASPGGPFDRYEVNVLVTQEGRARAVPIIEELHPTLGNLTGRVEYLSLQGALVTNFRLIKAGAIHRANGGYLLLDARNLLLEPFSWTALKRILKRGEIVIEDVNRFLGLTSTVTLEPDPIPLDLKIVLFGDRLIYYLLFAYDPELIEHFKVLADFEDEFDRTSESEVVLARLVASVARDDALRPLDREAVSLVIEHAARLTGIKIYSTWGAIL